MLKGLLIRRKDRTKSLPDWDATDFWWFEEDPRLSQGAKSAAAVFATSFGTADDDEDSEQKPNEGQLLHTF